MVRTGAIDSPSKGSSKIGSDGNFCHKQKGGKGFLRDGEFKGLRVMNPALL
jgi:hypothetical protein